MTDQTIDISGAEIPVAGPTLVSIRKTLTNAKAALRVAFEIDDAQDQIDAALQQWGQAEIQRRTADEAAQKAEHMPAPEPIPGSVPEDPSTAT